MKRNILLNNLETIAMKRFLSTQKSIKFETSSYGNGKTYFQFWDITDLQDQRLRRFVNSDYFQSI